MCGCVREVVCVFGGLSYAHEGRHVDCVVVLALGVSWSVQYVYLCKDFHVYCEQFCALKYVL